MDNLLYINASAFVEAYIISGDELRSNLLNQTTINFGGLFIAELIDCQNYVPRKA